MRNHTQTMLALYDLMLLIEALGGVFPEGITPDIVLKIKSNTEGAEIAKLVFDCSTVWDSLQIQIAEKRFPKLLEVCVTNRPEYSTGGFFQKETLRTELAEIITDFGSLEQPKDQ